MRMWRREKSRVFFSEAGGDSKRRWRMTASRRKRTALKSIVAIAVAPLAGWQAAHSPGGGVAVGWSVAAVLVVLGVWGLWRR
jgi:hypothetical protein